MVSNTDWLKMVVQDGKSRVTDVLDIEDIFQIIEFMPGPKAEVFCIK